MRRVLWEILLMISLQMIMVCSAPGIGLGSQILIRLSGDPEYPGAMSLKKDGAVIPHICFLGTAAKGKVDRDFLLFLAGQGIPEGEYKVSGPLLKEKWPSRSFRKSGALRLKLVSSEAGTLLDGRDLEGIAIHGRDFYPLLDSLSNKKMIEFYNDRLFDILKSHWGPLRISNWDMGRLSDYWKRYTDVPGQWNARVVRADLEEIRKKCKLPVTKRTPD